MGKLNAEKIVYGILAYFGILVLIPLLIKKKDKFIHYHSKQGLMLLIVGVGVSIISKLPIMGWILGPLLSVAVFIIWVYGIVNVLTAKTKPLPIIGKTAEKFKI